MDIQWIINSILLTSGPTNNLNHIRQALTTFVDPSWRTVVKGCIHQKLKTNGKRKQNSYMFGFASVISPSPHAAFLYFSCSRVSLSLCGNLKTSHVLFEDVHFHNVLSFHRRLRPFLAIFQARWSDPPALSPLLLQNMPAARAARRLSHIPAVP